MYLMTDYWWAHYCTNKGEVVERVANICMFISGLLISVSPAISVEVWPFFGFLIGHTIWLIVGAKMGKKTLVEVNGLFIILDVWAIFVRL